MTHHPKITKTVEPLGNTLFIVTCVDCPYSAVCESRLDAEACVEDHIDHSS